MTLTKTCLFFILLLLLSSPILTKDGQDDDSTHDLNDDKGGNDANDDHGGDDRNDDHGLDDNNAVHDANDDHGVHNGNDDHGSHDSTDDHDNDGLYNCTVEDCDLSDSPFIQFHCQERPQVCNEIYQPVCITECEGSGCKRTVANACTACSDPNVHAYTPGTCEIGRIICRQSNLTATNIACTDIYEPVCAYWSNCTAQPCGKTVGNACEACLQQRANYHTPGECGSDL